MHFLVRKKSAKTLGWEDSVGQSDGSIESNIKNLIPKLLNVTQRKKKSTISEVERSNEFMMYYLYGLCGCLFTKILTVYHTNHDQSINDNLM